MRSGNVTKFLLLVIILSFCAILAYSCCLIFVVVTCCFDNAWQPFPSLTQCYKNNQLSCCVSAHDAYIESQYASILSSTCLREYQLLENYFCLGCYPDQVPSSTQFIAKSMSFVCLVVYFLIYLFVFVFAFVFYVCDCFCFCFCSFSFLCVHKDQWSFADNNCLCLSNRGNF